VYAAMHRDVATHQLTELMYAVNAAVYDERASVRLVGQTRPKRGARQVADHLVNTMWRVGADST
jgi:hypothetical protein